MLRHWPRNWLPDNSPATLPGVALGPEIERSPRDSKDKMMKDIILSAIRLAELVNDLRIRSITATLVNHQALQVYWDLLVPRSSNDQEKYSQLLWKFEDFMSKADGVLTASTKSGRRFTLRDATRHYELYIDFGPDGSETLALEIVQYLERFGHEFVAEHVRFPATEGGAALLRGVLDAQSAMAEAVRAADRAFEEANRPAPVDEEILRAFGIEERT